MKQYSQDIGDLTVTIGDNDIRFTGVVYYPPVPATQIDPPEGSFVEWDEAFLGDVCVTELVVLIRGDLVTIALCDKVEGMQ